MDDVGRSWVRALAEAQGLVMCSCGRYRARWYVAGRWPRWALAHLLWHLGDRRG